MPTLESIDGASLAAPAGSYSRGLSAGTQMAAMGRQSYNAAYDRAQQQQQQQNRQSVIDENLNNALGGGLEGILEIGQVEPDLANLLVKIKLTNDQQAASKLSTFVEQQGVFAASIMGKPAPFQRQMLITEAHKLAQEGKIKEAENYIEMADQAVSNPDALNSELAQDVATAKLTKDQIGIFGLGGGDKKGFEQAKGKGLTGYVFNKDTGEYSINEGLKRTLINDANNLAGKDQLDAKDVAGINDKITSLISGVRNISEAASTLAALESSATPASKLAAVFKFMKAMDPTSTVRESEQGQVYAAEGAAKGIANRINAFLGKGGLSEEGFRDLVNTSRVIANSAIDSSRTTVADYLGPIEDNLTPKQAQKIKDRVPKTFIMPQDGQQPLKSYTSSTGVKFTVK